MSLTSNPRTFHGDDDLSKVIKEKHPKLFGAGQDFHLSIHFQNWNHYLSILKVPIYPTLLKKIGKNYFVCLRGISISFDIYGWDVSFTTACIVDAIKCPRRGIITSHASLSSIPNSKIISIFDTSSEFDSTNYENLNPFAKDWFHFILTNICPHGVNKNILTNDDNIMIFCLLKLIPINLPHIIFNNLKESITSSRNLNKSFIPYGRIMSKFFVQGEIERIIRRVRVGPSDALKEDVCETFDDQWFN